MCASRSRTCATAATPDVAFAGVAPVSDRARAEDGRGRRRAVALVIKLGVGAAAFVAALALIGGAVDAPLARIAEGLDERTAEWLHQTAEHVAGERLMFGALAVALLSGMAALVQHGRVRIGFFVLMQRSVFTVFAVAAAIALVQMFKYALGRSDPHLINEFGVFHFAAFSSDAAEASFPSGHATTAFAFATAVALFAPRWGMAFFLGALAVAGARVASGAHYASDALGGMVLGVAVTFALARACARHRLVFRVVNDRLVRRGEHLVRRALVGRTGSRDIRS